MSDATSTTAPLLGVSITSSAGVASGVLTTINQYAPVIGLCLTVISMLLAVTFFVLNNRKEHIQARMSYDALKEEVRKELLADLRKHEPKSLEEVKKRHGDTW